ncbi:MAG TPA: hypothetical protein VKT78_03790, partial [Fimbriimonadaceae bacterium]|nr:hypothetical protein [Fimbriimonadaceae bacterium]
MMLLSLALTLAGAPPTHIDLLHGAWPVAAPHAAITLHIPTAALRAVLGDAEEHEALPALKAIPRNLVAPGKEILDGIGAPGVHGPQNMFTAGSTGFDPAIAVGDQYVLVINDHMISFFDRNGNQLPSKAGGATAMSSTDFFKTFWQSKLANGQPNPNNINTHLAYNPNILHPDPNGDLSQLGMINEWYDSRCCFDPVSHRFFYLSAARNQLWFNDPKSNPGGKYDTCVRRYYAFAVSKTEDPRDGFNMWM